MIAHREATDIKAADEYMAMFNEGRTWRPVTYGYGYGYATTSKPIGKLVTSSVSEEKLRRHEAKFAAKDDKKLRRRSTPNLKGQVLELHSRGAMPAAIADTLNIADRRVKEIIRTAA